MTTLIHIRKAADAAVDNLSSCFPPLSMDYSLESIHEVEQYIKLRVAKKTLDVDEIISKKLQSELYALGCYVGEVMIKNSANWRWKVETIDELNVYNLTVISLTGERFMPIHEIMKIVLGLKGSLYKTVVSALYKNLKVEIDISFEEENLAKKKRWPRFLPFLYS